MQDQPEVITLSDSEDEFEKITRTRERGCRKRQWDNGLIGPKYPKMYAVEKEFMISEMSSDIDKIIENTLGDSEKRVLEENLLPKTKQRKSERNVYPIRNTTRYQARRSASGNFWKPKLVTKDQLDF